MLDLGVFLCQMSDWFTNANTDQWMQRAEPQADRRV